MVRRTRCVLAVPMANTQRGFPASSMRSLRLPVLRLPALALGLPLLQLDGSLDLVRQVCRAQLGPAAAHSMCSARPRGMRLEAQPCPSGYQVSHTGHPGAAGAAGCSAACAASCSAACAVKP